MAHPSYTQLLGKLSSFLYGHETASGLTPSEGLGTPAPPPAPPPPPAATTLAQGYESRLTATMAENGSAVSCRMQLVNLDKIAESFGARWPKMEKKVHSIIERILARRLSPADFYVRKGESDYYFLFSGLSEADAKIKCILLSSEIITSLMGDEAGKEVLAGLEIKSVALQINGPANGAATTLDALDQLLSRKQGEDVLADPAPDPGMAAKTQLKDILPLFEAIDRDIKRWRQAPPAPGERAEVVARLDGVARLLQQIGQAFANLPSENPVPDGASGAATLPAGEQQADAAVWKYMALPGKASPEWQLFHVLPGLIARTLAKVEEELKHQTELLGLDVPLGVPSQGPEAESRAPERLPFDWNEAKVVFSYLPMWQISKKVINSYLCQLALKDNEEIHPIEVLFDEDIDEVVIASLDRLVLREALKSISVLLKSNRRNNIVVPVHFATLASSRARRGYLGVLTLVRPEHRPYLIWELSYPHIGISNTPILQAVSLLRPYGRRILLRVCLDYRYFNDLGMAGVYAAGADIPATGMAEATVIHKMEAFKARAEQAGIKAYLHGANSLSLATAAVCAGFDHIDGDAVARSIDGPEGIQSYCIENPYAAIIKAKGIISSVAGPVAG